MSPGNFRSNSHYVPELYLKRWSLDGLKIPTYRLLVPHQNYPAWKSESLSSIAVRKHIYTQLSAYAELDDLEKWFDREFESPAEPVFQRVERGDRLSPQDWNTLVRFLALQDVRTPARMLKMLKQLEDDLPSLMKNTLANTIAEAQAAIDAGRKMQIPQGNRDFLFPISVRTEIEPDAESGRLGVETVVGRGMWLDVIKHFLTVTIEALTLHRWTILRPPEGMQWPTSDNPVIRLNYHSPENYNFDGGWGSKGTEILLPLSPRHLLYTHIGSKSPTKGTRVSIVFAKMLRQFVVENAHRYVFSLTEDDALSKIRKRHVDANAVMYERQEWEDFHNRNVLAERALLAR